MEPIIVLRRQTLYPTELRAHAWELLQFKAYVEPIATRTRSPSTIVKIPPLM